MFCHMAKLQEFQVLMNIYDSGENTGLNKAGQREAAALSAQMCHLMKLFSYGNLVIKSSRFYSEV